MLRKNFSGTLQTLTKFTYPVQIVRRVHTVQLGEYCTVFCTVYTVQFSVQMYSFPYNGIHCRIDTELNKNHISLIIYSLAPTATFTWKLVPYTERRNIEDKPRRAVDDIRLK